MPGVVRSDPAANDRVPMTMTSISGFCSTNYVGITSSLTARSLESRRIVAASERLIATPARGRNIMPHEVVRTERRQQCCRRHLGHAELHS